MPKTSLSASKLLCLTGMLAVLSIGAFAATPQQISAITQQFIAKINSSSQVIRDEEVNEYLEKLAGRLVKANGKSFHRFHFFLVNRPSINAFAGPGGYIGVHAGLILRANNEDEIAGVIAHEMGHVKQNHIIRQLDRVKAERLSMTLASIVAIALGSQNPDLGQAAMMTGAAGLQQLEINFTRGEEQEADRIGLELVQKAGFTPQGILDFFARMKDQERLSIASLVPDILKSHPVTDARIADIENRLGGKRGKSSTPTLEFEIFKAKLAHMTDSSLNITYQHETARDYARALTLIERARYKDFEALLPSLEKHKQLPSIQALLIDYYNGKGEPDKIKTIGFDPRLTKHEFLNTKLYWFYLENGKYDEAIELVQEALSHAPRDPDVWMAYAEIENSLKHEAEAYLYRAQAMTFAGRKHEAKRLLKIAQKKKTHREYTRIKIKGLLDYLNEVKNKKT